MINVAVIYTAGFEFNNDQENKLIQDFPGCRFSFKRDSEISRSEVGEAEVITGFPSQECVKEASSLKWLHLSSIGVDKHINRELYCSKDVVLTNSAGTYGKPISYHVLGLMLMLLFSLKLGWFPTSGVDTWAGYVLPVVTLSLSGIASEIRLTRSTMLETIRQDYIRTAKSKGAPEKIVIFRHALKNALLPVITNMGMNFGSSLGGAVIIETVFGIPGVGMLIVNSIRQKDTPMIMGATLFLAVLFCLVMLVVDILYAYIDPRLKAKYQS